MSHADFNNQLHTLKAAKNAANLMIYLLAINHHHHRHHYFVYFIFLSIIYIFIFACHK